jgi:polysaccharide export outer membrane protein
MPGILPLMNPKLFPFLNRVIAAAALLCVTLLLAGCQSPAKFADPAGPYDEATTNAPPDFHPSPYSTNALQAGDVVSIMFQYSTNFNAIEKITIDGSVNLADVGSVKAAGKTVTQLEADLSKLYKQQVKDDIITVKVVSSGNSVYISGAVIRPGKIAMERPLTALEAIMEAGGFDPNRAKLSQVVVVRLEDGKQKSYHLNLKHALGGEDEQPFFLKPFDIVHVPTKTFNY